MLVGLISSINISVLRAQSPCPTNIPPYPPDPYATWFQSGVNLNNVGGTNCDIEVLFCFRSLEDGTIQIYIHQINPLGSDCDDLTWEQLIKFARDGVHSGMSQLANCATNPCTGSLITTVQVFTSQCFKMVLNSTGTGANLAFCDVGAYCLKECTMCRLQPSGIVQECNCTYSSVSTPSGCEATPNDFGNTTVKDFTTTNYNTQSWPWTPGTCYTVVCGTY